MLYLVTTDISDLQTEAPIVMVDGTVPGWTPRPIDFHFDHHKPGGADVQIEEIPDTTVIPDGAILVTTQVDADACAAAAWLQLLKIPQDAGMEYDARVQLWAIAHDCDHLGLPEGARYDHLRDFARKAVASLKETGRDLITKLGLPENRKEWTEKQRAIYASASFKTGTEWLIAAALGDRRWPGESGEADSYFERMESQRAKVYENCRLFRGVPIFDQRAFDAEYVDPRLFVEWCRENNAPENFTLTVRDGSRQPNASILQNYNGELYSYTLGSIPLHPKGSPNFSDKGVWAKLAEQENQTRQQHGQPESVTQWGGRNAVGGSSWRDPMLTPPEEVAAFVLDCMDVAF